MTKATSLKYSKFLIKVSDGMSPETFAAPCGLTSRAHNETASVQETTVPDCDDEDAPAAVERAVDTLSNELTGSGLLAKESYAMWRDWMRSGESRKCRIYYFDGDEPDEDETVNAVGYDEGFFVLTQFNRTGERAQRVKADVTLQSDGEVVWHDAE